MTFIETVLQGDSVAEWLACWIQAQKARVQIAAVTLLGNSPRQTVYDGRKTHGFKTFHKVSPFIIATMNEAS